MKTKGSFLGEFEHLVLLAVLRLDGDAYGVTIRDEIESRTARDSAIGAVYAALGRLELKGYIRAKITAPEPVRGGRARKVFTMTSSGGRALHASREMTKQMADGLIFEPDIGR